jgi:uncharacterized protein (AIM24 family)
MQVEMMYQPSYMIGRVRLPGGEQVRVEATFMVNMSSGEGFVADLTRPGKFWLQTRSQAQFLS